MILSHTWKNIILISTVIACGIFLRTNYFEVSTRTPDEYHYQEFAIEIQQSGIKLGVKNLMNKYHAEKWRWNYPPPSRVGIYFLTALSQKITGDQSPKAGAYISTIASVLTLITIIISGYILAIPYLGIIAAFFYSFSPLSLALARRGWTDSFVELLMALLLVSVLLITKNKKITLIPCFLFFIVGAYSALVKESFYPMLALASAFACTHFILAKNWENLFYMSILTLITGLFGLVSLSYFIGGFDQLFLVYSHIKESVPQAEYAVAYQDGPWYDLIKTYFLLSPAFICYLFFCLLTLIYVCIKYRSYYSKNHTFRSLILLFLIVIIFITAVCIPEYFKNLRYLSPIYPVIYLLAGVLPASFLTWVSAKHLNGIRLSKLLMVLCALVIMYYDFQIYKKLIVDADCADLNYLMVKTCKLFILK